MQRMSFPIERETWVETAIVAKWVLQEAWFYCIEVLDQRYKNRQVTALEKSKQEQMYTTFFHQAFYAPANTKPDIDKLVKNARKMLSILKKLDHDAWVRFMTNTDKESG